LEEKLNTIIAYFEEEKTRLLQQIAEYTKEWEYQMAHFHAQALFQVNRRLQTLYSLKDRRYDEKRRKRERIQRLENRLQTEGSEYMRQYFSQELQKEKEAFEKLSQFVEPVNGLPDGGAFAKALKDLMEKKISGFKLFFDKDSNLMFHFSFRGKTLRVTFYNMKRHIKTGRFFEDDISVLQGMGFTYNKDKSRVVLHLQGDQLTILDQLNWRFAKLTFDFFDYRSFEGQSFLEVVEKASR
jgi:hypothetical protein